MKFKKFAKKLRKKLRNNAPRLTKQDRGLVTEYILKEANEDGFYYPLICAEEMAELIQVISKIKRYGHTEEYNIMLIEEMADVYATLDTMKEYFLISDNAIEYARDIKNERFLKSHNIKPNYIKEGKK